MKKITKVYLVKIISLVLLLSLMAGIVSGCFVKKQQPQLTDVSDIDVSEIVTTITESINETQTTEPVSKNDWKSLVGNLDAFVHTELMNEYSLSYETFNACIELEDGTHIYGIGYSDYDGYFERDDGKGGYFPAGFISYIGEPEIPEEQKESGLEVIDLDCEDPTYGFVLSYDTAPYMEHCVLWGQYLQYGVDDKGVITYKIQDYKRGYCDESLGALYSFDEDKYLYNPDVGNYAPITGVSLYETTNYANLEKEINRILEEQDLNYSEADVESAIYITQEAMNSYWLTLKEETFMGYKVTDLVKLASEIDPKDCIRITPEGYVIVDIDDAPPEEPSALVKWLTGITCGVVLVASIVAEIYVPALAPLMGAVQGVAVDVFMQVIVENHTLANVNWVKVGISALAGALLSWVCPAVGSFAAKGSIKILGKVIEGPTLQTIGNMCGTAALSVCNGVVGGATSAAYKYVDGGSGKEVFNTFLTAAALTASFTLVGSALSSVASKVSGKVGEKIKTIACKKPNAFMSKAKNIAEKISLHISDHQVHFKKHKTLEEFLVPKSIHNATKQAMAELSLPDRIKALPATNNPNFIIIENNGNKFTSKAQIKESGGNGVIKLSDSCDETLRHKFSEYNITEIPVEHGIPDFSSISLFEFNPNSGITSNRKINMRNYYKDLANIFKKGRKNIPETLQSLFSNLSEEEIMNLNSTRVEEILRGAGLTLHENIDGMVYVVDSFIHEKISHYGGVAWAKIVGTIRTESVYFSEIVHSSVYSITGSLLPEGV